MARNGHIKLMNLTRIVVLTFLSTTKVSSAIPLWSHSTFDRTYWNVLHHPVIRLFINNSWKYHFEWTCYDIVKQTHVLFENAYYMHACNLDLVQFCRWKKKIRLKKFVLLIMNDWTNLEDFLLANGMRV